MCWFKEEKLKFGSGSTKEASLGQVIHFEFLVMKIWNWVLGHLPHLEISHLKIETWVIRLD